jgi:hypothetical protein
MSRNYLRPVAIHFGATVVTSAYGSCVGSRDSHFERNGQTIIINEYTGKLSLNPQWFQNGSIDQRIITYGIQLRSFTLVWL